MNFSDQEFVFLQDQQFLLSKIKIGKKMELLFGEVEKNLYAIIPKYSWPAGVLVGSGKLSKGENYQGLPYYMLDYPRKFDKENVFSFRTMFWWGNFFSATLHLGGQYLDMSRKPLNNNAEQLISSNNYICINHTPWEYHYEPDNYRRLKELDMGQLQSMLDTKPFIKISQRWELDRYQEIPALVSGLFRETLTWMANSS